MIAKKINLIIYLGIVLIIGCAIYNVNSNLYIKTAVGRFYLIQKEQFLRKINKRFYKLPVPLNYIKPTILNHKITNPASWVTLQIEKDFSNFSNASVYNVIHTFESLPPSALLVLFTIKNGKLSVTKKNNYSLDQASERGVYIYSNIFSYIAEHGYVKNLSFLLRFSDYFTDPIPYLTSEIAPILTTSKDLKRDIDQNLILIPDYMSLEDIPKFMPKIRMASYIYHWKAKENKICWRGGQADVSGFRKSIVEYSEQHPHSIIDAKFVVEKNNFMHPEFQLKYKLLLNIDGHTAAWTRPIWQLQSNSVMVKQNSQLTQWYYAALVPDIHFISVDPDPVAVINKINSYTDEELYKIAKNGSEFAENNLTINDMVAYITLVLQKYENLQHSHNTKSILN